MPDYEVSANNIMYQFFPGEIIQGKGTVDAAGFHCPFVVPADFYTSPETRKFRQDAFFPTHTIPLSPLLPLYNYSKEIGGSLYPQLDASSSKALYQSPSSWLDAQIYEQIITGNLFTQDMSGGVTPSGALLKQTNKSLAGDISSIVGAIAKQDNKILSGAMSSITGALTKETGKILSGALSSITGALSSAIIYSKVLSGAITSITGALVNQGQKVLSGNITPSGNISKQAIKILSGALSSIVGTFNAIKIALLDVSGSIASSGILQKQSSKALTGSISIAGIISKSVSKFLVGVLASIGSLGSIITFGGGGPAPTIITLTLFNRSVRFTLPSRNRNLTLDDRDNSLTVKDE